MLKTNTIITIVSLALLALRFVKDFRRDKGQHKNAKIFQVILLGSLVFSYAGSIRYFGWMLSHFNEAINRYSQEIGLVSGPLNVSIYVLNLMATVTILTLCYLMAARNLKARKLFFFVIPVLAFTESFSFYRGLRKASDTLSLNDETILALGLLIFGGIAATNLVIYNTRFMKSFFYLEMDPEDKEDTDILDDIDLAEKS